MIVEILTCPKCHRIYIHADNHTPVIVHCTTLECGERIRKFNYNNDPNIVKVLLTTIPDPQ